MAIELNAAAGEADANSYVSVEDADTYHETHLYSSTWDDATDAQKIQALIWATRLLDEHFEWVGTIATFTQSLRWPRIGAYDRDGRLLDETSIPTVIANATAELGRLLIATDVTASATQSGNINYVQVGQIAIKYADGSAPTLTTIPDSVRSLVGMLGTYGNAAGSGGAITMRRG